MERRGISHTQLMALIWGGVLAPAAELLPGLLLTRTGKGAWLAPLLAAPLVMAGGWLLAKLSGGTGLARGILRRTGPVFGGVFLIIYMVWVELLLALRLRLCAQRLADAGERDGALWFFLLGLTVLVLWIGAGEIDAFARAGQLFFGGLLVMGGGVLLLAVPQGTWERLLPLWGRDVLPVLRGGLTVAGVLGWGCFGAFLMGDVADSGERRGRHWLFWSLGACLLLTAGQGVILSNLGAELASKLEMPFFALAKSVGIQGAFRRIEGLVAEVWLLADVTLAGVLAFAQRNIIKVVCPPKWERRMGAAAVLAAYLLALGVFRERGSARWWNANVVPVGNLIFGAGIPAALWVFDLARSKLTGNSTSCGGKTD